MSEIEIISLLEFGGRTLDWVEISISISPYLEESYKCACGSTHIIKDLKDGLIRQFSDDRIVLRNLECKSVTCFQITDKKELIPLYSALLD